VADDGSQADELSYQSKLSADGRYLVFGTEASNLLRDDTNGASDIVLRDRLTGLNTRVSPASAIYTGWISGGSRRPTISADGRRVAYWSDAVNLVPDDTNGKGDVFVFDRIAGTTTRVSVTADGSQISGSGESGVGGDRAPAISADGRYVLFQSDAADVVPDDTNNASDLFLRRLS
jgi:Tol biopolymer transport system component